VSSRSGGGGPRHAGRALRGGGAGPDREDARLPAGAAGGRVLATADRLPPRSTGPGAHHRRCRRGPVPADRLAGGGGGVRASDRAEEVRAHVWQADQTPVVVARALRRPGYFFFRSASATGL